MIEAALSLGLQRLFLSDFIIDLLLEPAHLLLQLTNEIHHSLTDTAEGKEWRERLNKGEEQLQRRPTEGGLHPRLLPSAL